MYHVESSFSENSHLIALTLLNRYEEKGDDFLNHIVAEDEKWFWIKLQKQNVNR